MKWRQPADKKVVEAVVAAFCKPAERIQPLLSTLSQRQWEKSYYWLDASGMALYLLARIEELQLEKTIPAATLMRLNQNRTDNRRRSLSLFNEYVELNRAFQNKGISYCNLKGFTLFPDSCPDPVLRCQLDLDFLVDGRHLEACETILSGRGYVARVSTSTVREYKTNGDRLADIADFYKPKPQRCVEIHFKSADTSPFSPTRDERLDRLAWRDEDGISIPTLSAVEQFIGQASHLFGHLCGPNTRLSWLLEFKRHIEVHAEEPSFWSQVLERAAKDSAHLMAVGVCSLLVSDLLGFRLPALLEEIIRRHVPSNIARWVQRYGRRAILADFPGTKLYLLLLEEINEEEINENISRDNLAWKEKKHKALLPTNRPPRIVYFTDATRPMERLQGELYQFRHTLFRLRFHIVEGVRYAIEAVLWRRHLERLKPHIHEDFAGEIHTTARHT